MRPPLRSPRRTCLSLLALSALSALCSGFGPPQESATPPIVLDPARAAALEAYENSPEALYRVPPEDHPAHLRGPGVPYGLGFCDDVLYGTGPGYIVRFDGADFTMHERGGPEHGSNWLSFTLDDIRRGDQLLYSRSGCGPARQDGFLATVALTPRIDARFEVGEKGVEQSFLFHELPDTGGDLVVRGRLQTGLERLATPSETQGLLFEGRSDVDEPFRLRYGSVTGIDATGRRVNGTLVLQGDELELRLPAAFLEQAVAPILLDPVVGPMDWELPTGPYYSPKDPAVAFDVTNQRYLAVWVESGYGGQHAIYGQFRSTSGAPIGGLILITLTDLSSSYPELANVNATNKFLIVYRDGPPLYARSIDAGSGQVSAKTLVATLSPSRVVHRVGGEVLPPFNYALVAWIDYDRTVGVRLVGCPASGPPVVGWAQSNLAQSSNPDFSWLSVSNSGGNAGMWVVGWSERIGSGRDTRGALVSFLLSSSPPTTLINHSTWDAYPAVTGDGINFAAASRDTWGVHARSFHGTLAGGLVPAGPLVTVGSGDIAHYGVELERVGNHYVVAWDAVTALPGPDISRIAGRKLYVSNCSPAEPVYTMSEVTDGETHSRLRLFSEKSATPAGSVPHRAMLIDSTDILSGSYYSYPYDIYATVISD